MFTASLAAGSTAGGCFISYIMFFMNSWRMPSMRFCMIIVFIWYARQKASTSTSTVLPTSCQPIALVISPGFTAMLNATASKSSGLVEYLTLSCLLKVPLTVNIGFTMQRLVL